MMNINRIVVVLLTVSLLCGQLSAQQTVPSIIWKPGYLDIHHINTGRGNAAFCIFPDGTTMLIDAGELSPLDERTFTPRNATIKPDSSKKPFEWIANYIEQIYPFKKKEIDYALITHFHDDHFGAWYDNAPLSVSKQFVRTGITGIGDLYKINMIIDRGYAFLDGAGEVKFKNTIDNYLDFIKEKTNQGAIYKNLIAGSKTQITLKKNPSAYSDFYVQNVKSSQFIWTGKDSSVINQFPVYDSTNRKTWPDENSLSLALTINYGRFSYYTGGDNPGMIFPGDDSLRNTETPISKAVGAVDVATMDHHGNRDALNETIIKTLRPKVWIGQTWSSDHPGHEVLIRLINKHIYNETADLFCTNMLEPNKLVIGPLIDRAYKSQQGHIMVRVLPGGKEYYIIILDDNSSNLKVKSVFGPYYSTSKN
jgi:hypothetical protein